MNKIYYGLKNIVGPKTVGPSSSHFTGPAKAGKFVYFFNRGLPKNIVIVLYNSMCDTGIGHRTPQGILGGLMGIDVADYRINKAWRKAIKSASIKIIMRHDKPEKGDLYDEYNQNKIEITLPDTNSFFRLYSTGGSNIIFSVVDGVNCCLNVSGWVCFVNYSQEQSDNLTKIANSLKLNYCLCTNQMIIEGKSLKIKQELLMALKASKISTEKILIIDNL